MVIFTAINRLTDKQVSTPQPNLRKKNPKQVRDFVETALSDGGGLYLVVKPGGTKSWMFLYTSKLTGKQEKLGLGESPCVSLQIARRLAAAEREKFALGTDPKSARDEVKAVVQRERDKERFTFKQLADAWRVESRKDRNESEGHDSRQYALLVNHVFPHVGATYIGDIGEPAHSRAGCAEPRSEGQARGQGGFDQAACGLIEISLRGKYDGNMPGGSLATGRANDDLYVAPKPHQTIKHL